MLEVTPLLMPCEVCDAAPGEPCLTRWLRHARRFHGARREALAVLLVDHDR
jgi:hypothetical protein